LGGATFPNKGLTMVKHQSARAQNLHFGAFLCGSQNFKASNLWVFARRPAFFHFGPVELRFSGLKKTLSHKRYII
jgi:hypothetical protein